MEADSEYLLKLATVKEFETALKYRQTYDDMVHEFLGLFKEFLNYLDKNGLEMPEKETARRITANVTALILSQSPNRDSEPDASLVGQNPELVAPGLNRRPQGSFSYRHLGSTIRSVLGSDSSDRLFL